MEKVAYKICPVCGAQSKDNAKFCIKCGQSLENEPVKLHVENGLYFKADVASKPLLFGAIPATYRAVGPVSGCVTVNSQLNADYEASMEALFNKLREVLNVNDLDGAANLSVISFNSVANGIGSVTLMVTGDGLVKAARAGLDAESQTEATSDDEQATAASVESGADTLSKDNSN